MRRFCLFACLSVVPFAAPGCEMGSGQTRVIHEEEEGSGGGGYYDDGYYDDIPIEDPGVPEDPGWYDEGSTDGGWVEEGDGYEDDFDDYRDEEF